MRISVFWVFDQDTDMHAPLQGLGRLLNLDIETRDIVLYKKQTKKMKRTTKVSLIITCTLTGSNRHVSSYLYFLPYEIARNENNLHTIIRIYRNVCDVIFI